MKKISFLLIVIAFLTCSTTPVMGQSSEYGKQCQFYNIDKTVKAKIGTGEDATYQVNSLTAFWPVVLNGKECPKLHEALCFWLTGKEDIKNLDRAIEQMLYTDNDDVPFGENDPYLIVDRLTDEIPLNRSLESIELKRLDNRFAVFHLFSNLYYAGAAHGMYIHGYITYDTELDKIVTLEDVLIDPELIRPYILESINLEYQYTEEDLFMPEDDNLHIPSQFYFENGLLHLVYQVYEIASFAQGEIDVPIFYPNDEKCPEYLTPYGKEVMEASYEKEIY